MPFIKKVKGWLKLGYKTFNNSRSIPIVDKDDGDGKMVVLLDDHGDDFVMPISDFAEASGGGSQVEQLKEEVDRLSKKITAVVGRLDDDALERTKGGEDE